MFGRNLRQPQRSIPKGGRERERGQQLKSWEDDDFQSVRAAGSGKNGVLLRSFIDPKKNFLARIHMKAISKRLRHYGLRYDDLFDPYYDLDIKEALNRLPREIVDARNQRLKRAMDLSMKHEYLPEDLQALQTPFRSYLQDMLALVKKENAEREALGALPLYQRTLP